MLVYLGRHCASAIMKWRMDNPDAHEVPPEFLPDSDVDLSELGYLQRDALGLYFQGLPVDRQPKRAYSSPAKRARLTTEGGMSLIPAASDITIDKRLREIEFGIFDGLTKKGRAARFPTEWEERRRVGKVHYRPRGGENWDDVIRRAKEFASKVLYLLPSDENVYLGMHEVTLHCFRCALEGCDAEELGKLAVPSASLTIYEFDGERFTLVDKNVLPPSPTGADLFYTESKVE